MSALSSVPPQLSPYPLHTENIMPHNTSHIGKKLELTQGYHLLVTDKYKIIKMTSQVNMNHAPTKKNRWLLGLEEKHQIHNIYVLFHINNVQDMCRARALVCRARPESKGQRRRTVGKSTWELALPSPADTHKEEGRRRGTEIERPG